MQITDEMKSVLERFEKAVRAEEMRGAQDIEDSVLIEEEYHAAKAELIECLSWVP
jgi:hypothetical protein